MIQWDVPSSQELWHPKGAFARDESTIERRGLHLQLAHLEGLVVLTAASNLGMFNLKGTEITQIYWSPC